MQGPPFRRGPCRAPDPPSGSGVATAVPSPLAIILHPNSEPTGRTVLPLLTFAQYK